MHSTQPALSKARNRQGPIPHDVVAALETEEFQIRPSARREIGVRLYSEREM